MLKTILCLYELVFGLWIGGHGSSFRSMSASNISGLEFDPLAHPYVKTFFRIICQYDLTNLTFNFNNNESHCGLFSHHGRDFVKLLSHHI